jgi:mRNA interferase MazF
MRPIHTARLDKVRPVLVLTRAGVRPHRSRVTVAPITSTVRGLSVELVLGPEDGLDRQSVANLDDVMTILVDDLGPQIGGLSPPKEAALAAAVFHAFELSW